MKKLLVLFVVGMVAALGHSPRAVAGSRFYAGLGIGKAEIGEADAIGAAIHDSQLAQWGLTQVSEEWREMTRPELAFSLTAGVNFGRYMSAELTYLDMLPTGYTVLAYARTPTEPVDLYSQSTDMKVSGPALSLIGRWPIYDRWQLFGRAGLLRAHFAAAGSICGGSANTDCFSFQTRDPYTGVTSSYTVGGQSIDFEATSNTPFIGLGVLFGSEYGGVRLEYTAARTRYPDNANATTWPSGFEARPLENLDRSGTMHSLGFSFYMGGERPE